MKWSYDVSITLLFTVAENCLKGIITPQMKDDQIAAWEKLTGWSVKDIVVEWRKRMALDD